MTGSDHHSDHHQVVSLDAAGAELLARARDNHAGRAAKTIASSSGLRATIIALAAGSVLSEHDSPAAGATLHVLTGRVRLHTADHEWLLGAGEVIPLPPQRHGLDAVEDATALLTVALR